MVKMWPYRFCLLALLITIASPIAHANPGPPIMMPDLILVAGPAFILWFVLGFIFILAKRKLKFMGVFPIVLAGVCIFIGLLDPLLVCWQIYLVLVIARLAMQKHGGRDPDWGLNLVFHGSFMAAMMIAGICWKIFYWHGRWGGWRYSIGTDYKPTLAMFIVCSVAVLLYSMIIEDLRKGAEPEETAKHENANSPPVI